jgi:uncharacterized membrane protein
VFQIETKKTHELSISNQAIAVLRLFNARTVLITAISLGRVVVVVPIATSYPVWSLIQARIFLRDVEAINWKIVTGILSVVAGNCAIHFGR